jgi:hypothetical protein
LGLPFVALNREEAMLVGASIFLHIIEGSLMV